MNQRSDVRLSTEPSKRVIMETEKTLRNISGIIKKNGRKILHQYPITSPQFIALQWVSEKGNLTIGELSHKIGLAFSTTTDLVDRMEKNDLVERVRDQKDRRVVRIHILDKGRTIIKEVVIKRQEYLGTVLSSLSLAEKEKMNEVLQVLNEQMHQLDEKEEVK